MLGIVTVDDVLDALIDESTEDVHKFGGVEALDKPYMQIGFFEMMQARRLAERAVPRRDADRQRDAALRGRTGARGGADPVHPADHEFGRQLRLAGHLAADPQLALRELRLRDWWKVALRELPTGMVLGAILGCLAIVRITSGSWAACTTTASTGSCWRSPSAPRWWASSPSVRCPARCCRSC
jgi:magnesium transporter